MESGSAPFASRVDVPGIATFSAAAAGLTYALIQANENGWATAETFGLLGSNEQALVVFDATQDFDAIRLTFGSVVGALTTTQVYSACSTALAPAP